MRAMIRAYSTIPCPFWWRRKASLASSTSETIRVNDLSILASPPWQRTRERAHVPGALSPLARGASRLFPWRLVRVEGVGDRVEHLLQAAVEGGQGCHQHDRDQGDDQAVLDHPLAPLPVEPILQVRDLPGDSRLEIQHLLRYLPPVLWVRRGDPPRRYARYGPPPPVSRSLGGRIVIPMP